MKKFLKYFILGVCLILSVSLVSCKKKTTETPPTEEAVGYPVYEYSVDGVTYSLNPDAKSYQAISYRGEDSDIANIKKLNIKSEIFGYPVTGIYSLGGYENVEEIVIPEGVTTIMYGFSDMPNLKKLELPSTLTWLRYPDLSECENLEYNTYKDGKYLGNSENPYLVLCDVDKTVKKLEVHEETKHISLDLYEYNYDGNTWNVEPYELEDIIIPSNVIHVDINTHYEIDNLNYTIYENGKYLGNSKNPYLVFMGTANYESIWDSHCYVHDDTKILGAALGGSHSLPKGIKNIRGMNYDTVGDIYYRGTILDWAQIPYAEYSYVETYTLDENGDINKDGYTFSKPKEVVIPKDLKKITNFIDAEKIYYDGSISDWLEFEFYNNYTGECFLPMYKPVYFLDSNGNVEYNGKRYSEPKDLVIPEGVEHINPYAFMNFRNLRSVTFPNSIKIVGCDAFDSSSFEGFYYNGTTTEFLNIVFSQWINGYGSSMMTNYSNPVSKSENDYFLDSNGDISHNGKKYSEVTELVIPITQTRISANMFMGWELENIYYEGTISDWLKMDIYVTGISCYSLNNFYFKDDNGTVKYGNNKYTRVINLEIPEGTKEIPNFAFVGFPNVISMYIPTSVEKIGRDPFDYYNFGYNSLVEVYNLSGIDISFGENVVIHTEANEKSIFKQVGDFVFIRDDNDVYNLVSYTGIDKNITLPSNVDGENYIISVMTNINDVESIIIPEGVTSIGNRAFERCSNLTSITIPSSVTSIGFGAFSGCNLTSITFEKGSKLTSIGDWAFEYCSNLRSITIPSSVTSIGDWAFSGCRSLASITFEEGSKLTSIGENAFSYCSNLTSITIPNGVTSIGNRAFYYCCKLIEVYNLSSLNIVAGSPDFGYVGYYANVIHYSLSEESIVKNTTEGYQYIKINNKYYLIGYTGNEEVLVLPKLINGNKYGIYDYAFSGCSNLTSITIPSSVTSIGFCAFSGCSNLTSITIPNGVTSIGDDAFSGCSNLTSITFEEGSKLTSIGDSAFERCSNLTSITIPEGVTSIGDRAFYDCYNLISVTFEEGSRLTSIGESAFRYCSNLTRITIPSSVTSIGDWAFYYCRNLTSITIPSSVTSIGYEAFYNCISLTQVFYGGNESNWNNISIGSSNTYLTGATRYYYSKTAPTSSGNYWHYDENGNVVIW